MNHSQLGLNSTPRTSQNFVRKKAALTLLRMYRKYPDVISAAEWALRIVAIMDDPDLVYFNSGGLSILAC
jgi:hypothetical protein